MNRLPLNIDLEDLAEQMAMSCEVDDLRKFVGLLCDSMQALEFDEMLLIDRYREVKAFYNEDSEKLDLDFLDKNYSILKE